jgi:hypothetical protein
MWRRTYLLLLLLRVYFALSPSYLHPDENFQGPEVFAGKPAMRFPCDIDDYPFATRLAFFLGLIASGTRRDSLHRCSRMSRQPHLTAS